MGTVDGMEIRGRQALVTGASGGLGHAIAMALADHDARLTITARRVRELEALRGRTRAEVLVADLTDRDDLERVVDACRRTELLVLNAGVGSGLGVAETTTEDIDRSLEVNLRAPIVLSTEFVRARLAENLSGHVVFVGSLSGLIPRSTSRLYSTTKFGLRGFALSLRQELHGTNVGVSIVEPGMIRDSGMFAESGVKLPRIIRTRAPVDVADAVLRGITRDAGEVFVAPLELRLAATVGTVAPGLISLVQRRIDKLVASSAEAG